MEYNNSKGYRTNIRFKDIDDENPSRTEYVDGDMWLDGGELQIRISGSNRYLGMSTVFTAADKTSATSTVAEDDELIVPVDINSTYLCKVALKWDDGAGTSGFKWGLSGPTNCKASHPTYGLDQDISGGGTALISSSSETGIYLTDFLITTGATAGDLKVVWSQKSLDAGAPTTLKAKSFISLQKI